MYLRASEKTAGESLMGLIIGVKAGARRKREKSAVATKGEKKEERNDSE